MFGIFQGLGFWSHNRNPASGGRYSRLTVERLEERLAPAKFYWNPLPTTPTNLSAYWSHAQNWLTLDKGAIVRSEVSPFVDKNGQRVPPGDIQLYFSKVGNLHSINDLMDLEVGSLNIGDGYSNTIEIEHKVTVHSGKMTSGHISLPYTRGLTIASPANKAFEWSGGGISGYKLSRSPN